jgi:hypothetical protein
MARRSAVIDLTPNAPRRLARTGGFAAALAAILLLIGVLGLVFGWQSLRPWLAALFGINAAVGGLSLASLRLVNPIDIALLALSCVAFLGFWPGPGKAHKVWMGLAILLPLAGIGVLLATGLWGRSGLMGGGLVLSVLMIGAPALRAAGFLGIAANLLLLVGDFATAGQPAPLVATLVAAGYVSLLAWLVWMAAAARRGLP